MLDVTVLSLSANSFYDSIIIIGDFSVNSSVILPLGIHLVAVEVFACFNEVSGYTSGKCIFTGGFN